MLYWALVFFIFSLVAAFLGFGGIAVASSSIAQVLFYLFVGLFLISIVAHLARKADKQVKKNLP